MAEKEYIYKNYALYLVNYFGNMQTWSKEDIISEIKRKITECPLADVAPVNHGHWIRPDVPNTRSYKWQCSECGQTAYWLHYGNRGNKNIICKYSYCPNCGAKMDGDTNGS